MPPARTIHVDTHQILQTIAAIAARQYADVEANTVRHENEFWNAPDMRLPEAECKRRCAARTAEKLAAELPDTVWVARDLQTLAGKQLTSSERIRHQQAMRKLEADGLVVLDSRHVRLTDKGKAAVNG